MAVISSPVGPLHRISGGGDRSSWRPLWYRWRSSLRQPSSPAYRLAWWKPSAHLERKRLPVLKVCLHCDSKGILSFIFYVAVKWVLCSHVTAIAMKIWVTWQYVVVFTLWRQRKTKEIDLFCRCYCNVNKFWGLGHSIGSFTLWPQQRNVNCFDVITKWVLDPICSHLQLLLRYFFCDSRF